MSKDIVKVKNKSKKGKKKPEPKPKLTEEEYKEIQKNKKKKEAALPLFGKDYDRFKDRLVELSGKKAKRDLVLFITGVATGYRTGDLVELTVGEIKKALKNKKFEILENKTSRACETYNKKKRDPKNKGKKCYEREWKEPVKRHVDIGPNLKEILSEYIEGRKSSEYAFYATDNNKNEPIKVKSYSEKITKIAKTLGLENISAHSARKIYAHKAYDNDPKNLEDVRIALGHKNIKTTLDYLGLGKIAQMEITSRTDDF